MKYIILEKARTAGAKDIKPRKKRMSKEERLRKLKEWADSEPKYRVKPEYTKSMTLDEYIILEKARTVGAKDTKPRKKKGMIRVRNPNPKGEPFIWVKPVKAESVVGFVPEGTREHLD
jgi:hypothetical protein